uniref:Zinc/iron permease n=1 Tax=Compsopogon caeruleus TaxID=31354 RepID=A0A7S1XH24_9RHOD
MDALSGGVLLGVAVVHLLPEALELMNSYEEERWHGFPVTLTVFLVGILLTVGVESVFVSHVMNAWVKGKSASGELTAGSSVHRAEISDGGGPDEEEAGVAKEISRASTSSSMDSETCFHGHTEVSGVSPVADLTVMFLGLSIHSVFAGLALGLGSWEQSLFLFIAIAAHKSFDAFAIGIQTMKTELKPWKKITVVIAYSLITPVPAIIGLSLNGGVGDIAQGVLQALGAGTLVALATVGYLGGITRSRWKTPDFLTYLAGVTIIVSVFIILHLTGVHGKAESHR